MQPQKHITGRVEIVEVNSTGYTDFQPQYRGRVRFEDGDEYDFETSLNELVVGQQYEITGGFEMSLVTGDPVVEITDINV